MKKCLIVLSLSTLAHAATVDFTPVAHVFDDGQKVTHLVLNTAELNLPREAIKPESFTIQVTGQAPIDIGDNKVFGLTNHERKVGKALWRDNGNLELHFEDLTNANTLIYVGDKVERTVLQNPKYQITVNDKALFPESIEFKQSALLDKAVNQFRPFTSQSGLNYQLFTPENPEEKHALILWLHGNGEGGFEDYQNNLSPILANRGGVAWTEEKTQALFGGAWVVVPQVPDTWYFQHKKGYASQLKALLDELTAKYPIDTQRIYLVGASAGGYMSIQLAMNYPETFAAIVVSAPALDKAEMVNGVPTTVESLKPLKGKALWLVHAENDQIINYEKTSKFLHEHLKDDGAILSTYPNVKIEDKEYNGHWSWIYALRNMPTNEQGQSLFEWLNQQQLQAKP